MSVQLLHPSKENLYSSDDPITVILAGTLWLIPLIPVQQMMLTLFLILMLVSWVDIHLDITQVPSGS